VVARGVAAAERRGGGRGGVGGEAAAAVSAGGELAGARGGCAPPRAARAQPGRSGALERCNGLWHNPRGRRRGAQARRAAWKLAPSGGGATERRARACSVHGRRGSCGLLPLRRPPPSLSELSSDMLGPAGARAPARARGATLPRIRCSHTAAKVPPTEEAGSGGRRCAPGPACCCGQRWAVWSRSRGARRAVGCRARARRRV